jgi:hypothetical protein
VNFNHNGGVSAINLSQRTVIVRETVHGAVRYGTVRTVHAREHADRARSCRARTERWSRERGGLGRGYDVENVIFVAEEEPRRVLQAWDVGRGLWV